MSFHTWVRLASVKAIKYYKYFLLVSKRKINTLIIWEFLLLGICFNTVFPSLLFISQWTLTMPLQCCYWILLFSPWSGRGGGFTNTKLFSECPGHDMNLRCKSHKTNFRFQWDETYICIVIAWITSHAISSHMVLVSSHRIHPQLHSISLMDIIWNVSVSCKFISEDTICSCLWMDVTGGVMLNKLNF
jgi:hypothetical protein